MTELRPNTTQATVTYGDKSIYVGTCLGKVVVTPNVTLVHVMLVETLSYNLLSVRTLGKMGFSIYFEPDLVVLFWSKTLEVAFVGRVKNELYVVDFLGSILKQCFYSERSSWGGTGIAAYPMST